MNKKRPVLICLLIMTAMILASCKGAAGMQDAAVPGAESAVAEEKTAPKEDTDTKLVTEEDYRNAIASAANDAEKLELYGQFAASYRMNADEYIDYAALCEAAGDTFSQRNALLRLYMIDPTEENGQRMSDMTLKITAADDEKAGELIDSVVGEIKKSEADDFSPEGLKAIFLSDEWKKSFYIDNGTFTSHTEYTGNGKTAVVYSDSIETRVTVTEEGSRYTARMSYDGTDAGIATKGDAAAGDGYFLRRTDNDGVDTVIVNGYTDNGHYVNQLEIKIGDSVYKGTLDKDGKTEEEQPAGLNGTAYAYTQDRSNYLYAEGTDASSWVADIEEMGFEEF